MKNENKNAQKRVSVYIPLGDSSRDDPNYFVSVNGTAYVIPRGKTVEVPEVIANEIYRAQRAEDTQKRNSAAMADAAKMK